MTVIYISSVPTIWRGVEAQSALSNEIILTVGARWPNYRFLVANY